MTTVVQHVECPRCFRARWHATGQFNVSRRNLRRAELVCDSCSYPFSSARPEAIAAGEAIIAERGEVQAEPPLVKVPQPSLPHSKMYQSKGLTGVMSMAEDWKKKQAGDAE